MSMKPCLNPSVCGVQSHREGTVCNGANQSSSADSGKGFGAPSAPSAPKPSESLDYNSREDMTITVVWASDGVGQRRGEQLNNVIAQEMDELTSDGTYPEGIRFERVDNEISSGGWPEIVVSGSNYDDLVKFYSVYSGDEDEQSAKSDLAEMYDIPIPKE